MRNDSLDAENNFITNTFSVAGRCSETNQVGAIVTTSAPAVGARVVKCKSGTGVVLSQNMTDPRLADVGISILDKGFDAHSAVQAMKAVTPYPDYRQLAVVDISGKSAVFTGKKAFGPYNGEFCAENVAAIGNFLGKPGIPEAMGKQFIADEKLPLTERLLSAIEVGFEMGGEIGPEHSMALVVYTDNAFPLTDLRVDYSEDPLEDMKSLWKIWEKDAMDFTRNALNAEERYKEREERLKKEGKI